MDSLRRQSLCILLMIASTKVNGQSATPGQPSISFLNKDLYRDPLSANINQASPTPLLMNSLLAYAASKGVLPDILPVIGPTLSEGPVYQTVDNSKNLLLGLPLSNINHNIDLSGIYPKAPTFLPPAIQALPPVNMRSVVPYNMSPVLSDTQTFARSAVSPISQTISNSVISQANSPNSLSTSTSSTSETMENLTPKVDVCTKDVQDAFITDENGTRIPVNLNINVQSPPSGPKIIVLPVPTSNGRQCCSPPPRPPVYLERSKSKGSWLPLLLIALLGNDGGCGGSGNCCCSGGGSCCCGGSSNSNAVPVPYPIPFPTNNPIITRGPRYSNSC